MSLKEQIEALRASEGKLQADRMALEQALQDEAKMAWATVRPSYDYRAVARGPYGLRVERKASATYLREVTLFNADYPELKQHPDLGWYGMDYWLVGNVLIQSGGAAAGLILRQRANNDVFYNLPIELTPDELEAFNNGQVPQHLRNEK